MKTDKIYCSKMKTKLWRSEDIRAMLQSVYVSVYVLLVVTYSTIAEEQLARRSVDEPPSSEVQ